MNKSTCSYYTEGRSCLCVRDVDRNAAAHSVHLASQARDDLRLGCLWSSKAAPPPSPSPLPATQLLPFVFLLSLSHSLAGHVMRETRKPASEWLCLLLIRIYFLCYRAEEIRTAPVPFPAIQEFILIVVWGMLRGVCVVM